MSDGYGAQAARRGVELGIGGFLAAKTPLAQIAAASMLEGLLSRLVCEVIGENPELTWGQVGSALRKQMEPDGTIAPYGNRQGPRQRFGTHPVVVRGRALAELGRLKRQRDELVALKEAVGERLRAFDEGDEVTPPVRLRGMQGELLDSLDSCVTTAAHLEVRLRGLDRQIADQEGVVASSGVHPINERSLLLDYLTTELGRFAIELEEGAGDQVLRVRDTFDELDEFVDAARKHVSSRGGSAASWRGASRLSLSEVYKCLRGSVPTERLETQLPEASPYYRLGRGPS